MKLRCGDALLLWSVALKCANCHTKSGRRHWSILCSSVVTEMLHISFLFCTKRCMKAWCDRFRERNAPGWSR